MTSLSDAYFCAAIVAFFLILALLLCWAAVLAWQSGDRRQQAAITLCLLGAVSVMLGFLILFLLPRDSYGTTHEPFWVDAILYGGYGLIAAGHSVRNWGTWFLPSFWVGSVLLFTSPSHVKPLEWLSIMLIGASVGGWKIGATFFGGGQRKA